MKQERCSSFGFDWWPADHQCFISCFLGSASRILHRLVVFVSSEAHKMTSTSLAALVDLPKLKHVQAMDADASALAHHGRLKVAHELTADLFGSLGEKCATLWGEEQAKFAFTHAPRECMDPSLLLVTSGQAALTCLNGAKVLGNEASPSPAAVFLFGVGAESVGKSRQTSYAKKLLDGLAEKIDPAAARQNTARD